VKASVHLGERRWSVLEAWATGLAYGGGLCWVSVCLVGSFRPADLGDPYWSALSHLRTDTTGIGAFFVVAVCLSTSEYMRLRRRRDSSAGLGSELSGGTPLLLALSASRTIAILATGLVVYLSVNTVTHPATLDLHATHLAPWPTEGTLRVLALFCCVCSVTMLRYLRARPITSQRELTTTSSAATARLQ
jgi:hypothetical protein